MAKIQGVTRKVSQPASLGQARGSTSLFEPIAQGAQQFGTQLDKLGFEMDKKKALADIEEAKTAMRERSLERSLYDRENRQGESALDSDDAPGVYKQYEQDSTQWVEELSSKVSPRFKDLARRELGGIQEGYMRQQAQYQSQQLGIYRENAVKNGLASTKMQTVALMEEPGTGINDIDTAAEEVRVTITANSGGRNVDDAVRAAQATLFSDSIIAKMDTDPAGALEIFEAGHEDYLGDNPQAATKLREAIDEKRVEVGIETSVSTIANNFDLENQFGDALEAAAQIPDDDIRKGVQSELKHNKSQLESIRLDKQRDSVEGYNDRIGKGDIPSELEVKQDPTLDSGMERLVLRWSQAEKDGVTLKTDQTVYQELNNLIAGDIEAFKKINFAQNKRYQDGLSQADWRSFSNMQRDLRLGKTGGKPATITHAMTLLKPQFSSAGITVGAKAKEEDNEAYIFVQNEVARWIGAEHDKGNTTITDDEILKKANSIFRDHKTSQPKSFLGIGYTSRFDGKIFELDYNDIPAEEAAELTQLLKNRGIAEPTEQQVTDWYKRYLLSLEEG